MVSRETILASRRAFTDWGVWPRQRADIDPSGWLANFDADDQSIAEALLDAFVFFNNDFTEQLFVSAMLSISTRLDSAPADRVEDWRRLLGDALITFPGSEDQNPTDSGHRFATIVRNRLAVDEANIFWPADMVRHLAALDAKRPLIIVDDFAGSGDQFLDTWHEMVVVTADRTSSLVEEVRRLGIDECFLVVVAITHDGLNEIKERAPEISVIAAHALPPQASLRHPATNLVPGELVALVAPAVEKYSRRAGVVGSPWGHRELGVSIGFEHGVPDGTLPLYWHSSDSWVPLRRRR